MATDELLQQYMNEETYSDYFVNLSPYINDSGVCVPLHFSLHRAYILFRTLGLRHMTVVSHTNQVEGILTRKDLMGFAIGERLERLLTNPPRKLSRSVVLALRKNYGHKHMQKAKDNNANGGSEAGKLIQPEQGSGSNGSNKPLAPANNDTAETVTETHVAEQTTQHSTVTQHRGSLSRGASLDKNSSSTAPPANAAGLPPAENANHLPSETVINTNHLV